MDLPRSFTIRESSHRILNPLSSEKLAVLGQALQLPPETRLLDLACGKGELLSTWARDHQAIGTGVDISTVFLRAARARAHQLGVSERVDFIHDDASTYVDQEPVDVASCLGATWIGGGVAGTITLLEGSLRPGGIILIGEPFWREDPPDQAAVEGSHATRKDDWRTLPDLIELFLSLGWDVIEMVLADQDSWDRYVAAQWFNQRAWLNDNPDDDLAGEIRADLTASQLSYPRYCRHYLGWGVFALMRR